MNKYILGMILAAVVSGGIGYFAGSRGGRSDLGRFADISAEERAARIAQFGDQRPDGTGARFGGGVAGEIISRSENSITISTQDGGSRIVLVPDTVSVLLMTEGSTDDLTIGTSVIVNGEANDDGSVTARSIQIGSMPIDPEQ